MPQLTVLLLKVANGARWLHSDRSMILNRSGRVLRRAGGVIATPTVSDRALPEMF
jgi:hypothetical protein